MLELFKMEYGEVRGQGRRHNANETLSTYLIITCIKNLKEIRVSVLTKSPSTLRDFTYSIKKGVDHLEDLSIGRTFLKIE